MKKKCPKCGGDLFYATVCVAQEWILDESGSYVETNEDYLYTLRMPDEDDLFMCKKCHYEAAGYEFNVKENG